MRYKQDGAAVILYFLNAGEAFALECFIPYRQGFVNDQYVGFDIDGGRKGQSHIHPAGISPHRLVHEGADIGESGNPVKAAADFVVRHPHDGGVEVNVFLASELRIETRAQFQERRDPPSDVDFTVAGRQGSADELQERGFSGTIATHDADGFSSRYREGNILEGLKFAIELFSAMP